MKPYVLLACLAVFPLLSAVAGNDLDLPVEPPPTRARPAPPPEPDEQGDEKPPSIYGRELAPPNASIVYVIDVSGSMSMEDAPYTATDGSVARGSRLDRAKAELERSIQRLPDGFELDLLAYDCDASLWAPNLRPATAENKRSAIDWVRRLVPGGATGTGPSVALALAFRSNRLVVLLTDGDPNCYLRSANGSLQDPDEHRRIITAANSQGATVDVFGIGATGRFREFCVGVASDNRGTYSDVR